VVVGRRKREEEEEARAAERLAVVSSDYGRARPDD